MNELLGSSLGVFLGVTVMLMGFCAAITGQAIANTWRPMWQIFPYCILLGGADRFLHFSLFGGDLLSVSGFLIDTAGLRGCRLRPGRSGQDEDDERAAR